jgi:hypothetical protein
MRINAILGALAALALMTAPALANNSKPQATPEPEVSSSCSALQKSADGTWVKLPCQEVGSPAQPPRQSATRNPDRQTR